MCSSMEDVEGLLKVSKLNDDDFQVLLPQVLEKILERQEDDLIATLEGAGIDRTTTGTSSDVNNLNRDYKHAFAALSTLILEIVKSGAKIDLDAENEDTEISKILRDSPISMAPDRIASIFEAIGRESLDLEKRLCECSNTLNFDKVVDVQWRMDYQIRSSITGKLNEPVYYVKLKTLNEKNKPGPDATFQCSLQQLEDLVQQLQDAQKQVERILTN
mmetsp:Transcript_15016/g.18578  ORF Transcript_15016/g.18578 Transcript_15016/m.18578 type:complete len:217 (+) Transcript_15016:226-876(+)